MRAEELALSMPSGPLKEGDDGKNTVANGSDPWVARIVVVGPLLMALVGTVGVVILSVQHDEVPPSLAGTLIGVCNIMSALAGYVFGRANQNGLGGGK